MREVKKNGKSYDRLIAAGYSVQEAKEKIGAVVIEEIYDVMKENQPYDEQRYAGALEKWYGSVLTMKIHMKF